MCADLVRAHGMCKSVRFMLGAGAGLNLSSEQSTLMVRYCNEDANDARSVPNAVTEDSCMRLAGVRICCYVLNCSSQA
jgi:hypothetical protein